MRNLKRALSLLLSSTMVLGMVVMGGSAVGYQDVDASNDNQEAIEVLQAVGIMSGVDDAGNFDPDGSITRNEMAVVMAHLLNLDYDYYRGTNTFSDVPEWAAPYVAACVAEGVTAGIGNGLYGGDQKITAAQAGLMVMKALGYFQNQEDFGEDWQVATIRQASYIDLFNKVNSNAESALTRGQVAQLVLNGLKAKMVDFTGDKGIQIGDVTVGYKAEYTPKTSAAAKYNSIDDGTTNIAENDQYYIQLGEELYNGELKLSNGTDNFERPSRVWSYESKEIGTYVKNELMVAEYTTGVTGKDLYNVLTAATIRDNEILSYVDGKDGSVKDTDLVRSNDDDLSDTGNGVLTQVFVDNNRKEVTISSINTWLAQATADYSESKEYAPVKVYTGIDAGTTLNSVSYNVDVEDVSNVVNVKDEGFYLVNISYKDNTKGDVVAIMDPKVMEDSTITKYSTSDDKVISKLTTDGEEYNAAQKAFFDAESLDNYNASLLTDMTYNIYLDQYGYVIGVELYEGAMKYVFITGFDRPTSNLSVRTAEAGAIFLDGTMKQIQVNVKDTNENIAADTSGYFTSWDDISYNGNDGNPTENRWYSYTVNENGVYTLKPANMTATLYDDLNADKDGFEDVVIDTANVYVDADAEGITDDTRVYGEDDSVFITVDTDLVDTTGTQEIAITDVTGVYTGVQSVDLEIDTSTETITGDASFDFGVSGANYTRDPDAIIEGQVYTVYDKNNYIIGAVAMADATGSVANYAYILDGAKSEELKDGVYYWEFDAILNGEVQTLTAKSEYTSIFNLIRDNIGNFLELRFDGDNYVVKAATVKDRYTDFNNKIDGEDVYFIQNLTNPGDFGGYESDMNTLSLQGRTFYATNDQKDVGLAIASDAKAVVIQDENGKSNVKTEFDSVSAALSYLADADPDAVGLQYKGTVGAVLNGNATAAWLVFDSNTELTTGTTTNPGDDSTTNGRITITLTKDSAANFRARDVLTRINASNELEIAVPVAGSNDTVLTSADVTAKINGLNAVVSGPVVVGDQAIFTVTGRSVATTDTVEVTIDNCVYASTIAAIKSGSAQAGSNSGNGTAEVSINEADKKINITLVDGDTKFGSSDTFTVTLTATDGATMDYGTLNLSTSDGDAWTSDQSKVVVTAPDKTTKIEYTVEISHPDSAVATVKSATATEVTDSGTGFEVESTATVDNEAKTIVIHLQNGATAQSGDQVKVTLTLADNATCDAGSNEVTVDYTDEWGTGTVTVTAQDGKTTATYTVSVVVDD